MGTWDDTAFLKNTKGNLTNKYFTSRTCSCLIVDVGVLVGYNSCVCLRSHFPLKKEGVVY